MIPDYFTVALIGEAWRQEIISATPLVYISRSVKVRHISLERIAFHTYLQTDITAGDSFYFYVLPDFGMAIAV